jgi:hypothetical protein
MKNSSEFSIPSFFIFHSSFFILHFSFFILHSSFFIFHFSFFIFHFSFFIFHSSFLPHLRIGLGFLRFVNGRLAPKVLYPEATQYLPLVKPARFSALPFCAFLCLLLLYCVQFWLARSVRLLRKLRELCSIHQE